MLAASSELIACFIHTAVLSFRLTVLHLFLSFRLAPFTYPTVPGPRPSTTQCTRLLHSVVAVALARRLLWPSVACVVHFLEVAVVCRFTYFCRGRGPEEPAKTEQVTTHARQTHRSCCPVKNPFFLMVGRTKVKCIIDELIYAVLKSVPIISMWVLILKLSSS